MFAKTSARLKLLLMDCFERSSCIISACLPLAIYCLKIKACKFGCIFYLCTKLQRMILPIRAYGDPVLREQAKDIDENYKHLDQLIQNMFDTMEEAYGVGLAAPQIGLPIRLFIVDLTPFAEDENYEDIQEELTAFRKVFINAKIIERKGEEWKFNEGCLSIPGVREDVERPETIVMEYYDENWQRHQEEFSDIRARVIQHEYDHIEGIMFTDYLTPFKKKLVQGKLKNISKGKVKADYSMKFPN